MPRMRWWRAAPRRACAGSDTSYERDRAWRSWTTGSAGVSRRDGSDGSLHSRERLPWLLGSSAGQQLGWAPTVSSVLSGSRLEKRAKIAHLMRESWLRVGGLPLTPGGWVVLAALACPISACGSDDDGTEVAGTGGAGDNTGGATSGSAGSAGTGSGGDVGSGGTGGVPSDGPSINDLGTSCDGGCPDGLTAVEYCGFAGCDVATFCSCEIRCTQGAASSCPDGTTCATVDDGPGEVCVRDSCSSSAECGSAACCGVCDSLACTGQCWDVSNGIPCRNGQMEL